MSAAARKKDPYRTPVGSAFRPEIQALRAVAVAAVVIYHVGPSWLSGGYVGVDVFFVISGFLITSHLAREFSATGTISIVRFYERRVRRLLPAAFAVLAFAAVAYFTVMPESTQRQGFLEIVASSLYAENWVLAYSAVDYFGATIDPSLVQHYWSLSVEEQFYILWPLLLLGVGFLSTRGRRNVQNRAWPVALGLVLGISLFYSVVATAVDPSWAYLVTPARAWEFAAGAMVAIYAAPIAKFAARHRSGSAVVSWIGLFTVVGSAVGYSDSTPFPGSAAIIPVVGAVLVIAAGNSAVRWSPMLVGRTRPVQYLGNISYSVYLWHWPLIVIVPVVVGHPLTATEGLAIVVVTVGLAALSKTFIEDRFTRRTTQPAPPVRAFTAAAAAAALLVTLGAVQVSQIDRHVTVAMEEAKAVEAPCFGARALGVEECGDARSATEVDTVFAAADYSDTALGDCGKGIPTKKIGDSVECSYGSESSGELVVMLGDSHSDQWLPAVQAIGEDLGWRVITLFRSSCPFTTVTPTFGGISEVDCERWKSLALQRIEELQPSLVMVASLVPDGYAATDYTVGPMDDVRAGYVEMLDAVDERSTNVVVIKDTPFMGANIPNCLGSPAGAVSCERPRGDVLEGHRDPLWEAALETPGIKTIALTDSFCDSTTCFPITGGVVVYRDHHHISATFARSMATPLLDKLTESGVLRS